MHAKPKGLYNWIMDSFQNNMTLYRSVGLQELALIYDGGMKAFPARLPQQPIFYPVLNLEYARQTASDWNVKNGQFAGYVTQFKVEEDYISQFETHAVGSSQYQELWIPTDEVESFNAHIIGHIKVVEAYFGDAFQGFVPEKFGLQGKNAVEQFTLLANSYLYKRMEFYLEIKRNHKAVFLNYPFWQTHDFKNPGLKEKVLQAIKEAWLASFPQIPLPLPPVRDDLPPARVVYSSTILEPGGKEATPVEPINSPTYVEPDEEEITLEEDSDSDFSVEPEDEDLPPAKPAPIQPIHEVESLDEKITPIEETAPDSEANPVQEEPLLVKPEPAPRAVHSIGKDIKPPERPDPRFVQGIKLGFSGAYREAIGELSRLVAERPGHIAAQASLGVAFHRAGEDDRALTCYEAALKTDPIYAEAHYFRANILYRRGQVREAITGYTVAIGLKPELIEAHQQPAPEDRLTDYNASPAEIPRIAKPARRILALNQSLESTPRQAKLLKERAAAYYRLRNYVQAIADYSSALALQPQDAEALHLRGVAYEQLGQHDRAHEEYRKALTIDPQLSAMYIQRGVTHGSMGNLRQSIVNLTEGIRLDPRNPDSYFNRGTAYFQQGDFEQAIADFSKVIQLSPNDEGAYYWRGVSHEQAGHRQGATSDYRRFLTLTQDALARAEIEQKLSQWSEGDQNHVQDRSVVPNDSQGIKQAQPEKRAQALDLQGLVAALGERAFRSTWFGSGVTCYGEKAAELYAFTDQDRPINGRDFLRIVSGIQQTITGDFYGVDPGGDSPWIFLRAWDGNGFYIEIDDPQIEKQLRAHFPAMEEVEGAQPPYTGLFIPI